MRSAGLGIFLLLLLHLPVHLLFAQEPGPGERRQPVALTPSELYSLSALPPLEVPERYTGKAAPTLPWWVDNSTQPYFRSITTQTGFECGQSAGISFVFTYEIDRLRNLPADTIINQYPSHFTWDFLNGGERYGGASCFDSWEIVRRCGNMNVADYGGGLGTGGYLRWISGYDYYYKGMFNRINSMHSIRVDSPEGLNTLKYWLSDHLEGSGVGGVAILYGTYFHPDENLPEGTPEGGKYVEAHWGPMATHTFTVVGYNDSIRFDYNGDGLYTNDLDITNDGIVDMHDWEIGGLKIASGFDGPSWSNDGFIYTMYKCLADNLGYGGIWNHSVYVISVRETCEPKLTAKVILKHTSRNKIRVTTGISTDLQATTPSYTLEFPIFNFQGGDNYMQGDTTEAAKTIEFGLDLSPLVNNLENGQQALFFLQVEEKDPQGTAEGEIIHFSVMDYTNGSPQTIDCPQTNVPLVNNSVTRIAVVHSVTTGRPEITTAALPDAKPFEPYSFQMTAAGGTPPYRWDAVMSYFEAVTYDNCPPPEGEKLLPENNNSGYSVVSLPFAFPFYHRIIDKLYIYPEGYIAFDDQPYSWPFLIDRNLLYKHSALICPFMSDLELYPEEEEGIWYKAEDHAVTIRWKASVHNYPGTYDVNFAVKLYKTGEIQFYYGPMHFPASLSWIGGLSAGDNLNWQHSSLSGKPYISGNTSEFFNYCQFPDGMKISGEGLFSGTTGSEKPVGFVDFRVTDNNNISSVKRLFLDISHLPMYCDISVPPDSILHFGDTVSLDLTVSAGGDPGSSWAGLTCRISCNDTYCRVIDSICQVVSIAGGQTLVIPDAFKIHIDPAVPDMHTLDLVIDITTGEYRKQERFQRKVHAPHIIIDHYVINDENDNRLDPGETAGLNITFKNTGSAVLNDAKALLNTVDKDLAINTPEAFLGSLPPGSSATAEFSVTAATGVPFQHVYRIDNLITGEKEYSVQDTSNLYSRPVATDDFETGDYKRYDWQKAGNGIFTIDTVESYEGRFCAKSGWIVDGLFSALYLNANVLCKGEIRFFMKVSCEYDPSGNANYDHLAFFIDDREVGRWDGEIDWTLKSFEVEEGYHQFKWIYQKDFTYTSGSNCAWLDLITFPPMNHSFPVAGATPASLTFTVYKGVIAQDTVLIRNTGYEDLGFSTDIQDLAALPKNLRKTFDQADTSSFRCITDGIIPGESFDWTFSLYNNFGKDAAINRVKLNICEEILITGIQHFIGGSAGDLQFRSVSADSTGITWSGKTASGTGVLLPGETATASFTGVTGRSMVNDLFLVYTIFFDTTAGKDSIVTGTLKIPNRCLPNAWLTLEPREGTRIRRGEKYPMAVKVDTRDLSDGTYRCNIIIKDGSNNNLYVPVTVHVIDSTDSPDHTGGIASLLKSYPNPFSGIVSIEFENRKPGYAEAIVYDMYGRKIRRLFSDMIPEGKMTMTWDRKSDNGVLAEPGIYYCTMRSGDDRETIKLILVR